MSIEDVLMGSKGIDKLGIEKFKPLNFRKSIFERNQEENARNAWGRISKAVTGAKANPIIETMIEDEISKRTLYDGDKGSLYYESLLKRYKRKVLSGKLKKKKEKKSTLFSINSPRIKKGITRKSKKTDDLRFSQVSHLSDTLQGKSKILIN